MKKNLSIFLVTFGIWSCAMNQHLFANEQTDAMAKLVTELPAVLANGIGIFVQGLRIFDPVKAQLSNIGTQANTLFKDVATASSAFQNHDLGTIHFARIGETLGDVIPASLSVVHMLTPTIRRFTIMMDPFMDVVKTSSIQLEILNAGTKALEQTRRILVLVNRIDTIMSTILPRIEGALAGLESILKIAPQKVDIKEKK